MRALRNPQIEIKQEVISLSDEEALRLLEIAGLAYVPTDALETIHNATVTLDRWSRNV